MPFTEFQIHGLAGALVWPLLRISAMLVAVPLFSLRAVPVRVRLMLALVLTFVIMPLLPASPMIDLFSYTGIRVAIVQVLVGLSSGFIVQLVFATVVFAGQTVALSMGLGFASMIDPQNGQQVPVVAQFYVLTSTLIFLSLDGHLLLIKMILDSFASLPIGIDGLTKADIWAIIAWSGRLFAGGLLLAMPMMVSLLLVNIGFGIATRVAPQLNIFSVGFPVTLILGMLLIWLTLPNSLDQFTGFLTDTDDLVGQLLRQ